MHTYHCSLFSTLFLSLFSCYTYFIFASRLSSPASYLSRLHPSFIRHLPPTIRYNQTPAPVAIIPVQVLGPGHSTEYTSTRPRPHAHAPQSSLKRTEWEGVGESITSYHPLPPFPPSPLFVSFRSVSKSYFLFFSRSGSSFSSPLPLLSLSSSSPSPLFLTLFLTVPVSYFLSPEFIFFNFDPNLLSVNSVYPYLLPLGSRKMLCRCRCCRCCFLRSWRNKTIIKLKLNEKKRKENGMEWKWNKPEWNGILMLWYLDVLTPGVYRYLMAWCLMSNVWCRGCQCTHYTYPHSLTHPPTTYLPT